ncbi:MAG: NRDE family protein [Candidatus Binatia bacterium]
MCTLAVYLREFDDYPLVVAANRDEHYSRPSASPWLLAEDPAIFGGRDLVAGGTWLGVNEHGLVAAIVNRRVKAPDTAGAPRSRGLLCRDMLRAQDAAQAAEWLQREDGSKYQPFVFVIAGATTAFVAFNSENGIRRLDLDPGLHVFGNTSFSEFGGGKLNHAREMFSTAAVSMRTHLKESGRPPDTAVEILHGVLSDHSSAINSEEPKDALCVHIPGADYGTVSSSIVFRARAGKQFYFYHAPDAPCRAKYQAVNPPQLS